VHTGNVYGEQFCYHDVPDLLDPFDFEEYRRNPMEFYVVATDINCGEPVYKRMDHVDQNGLLWLRASASIPLASKIVCVDGYELLDGGIGDSVPLSFMEKKGYERNVVVLTRPMDYIKRKTRMMPAARVVLRHYPKMIVAMEDRHLRYNANIAYVRTREESGDVFVIRPPKAIETDPVEHSRQRLLDAYRMGRETMEGRLDQLRAFLHYTR
jgi:predicted patatin/cPLA2 family phospholipase